MGRSDNSPCVLDGPSAKLPLSVTPEMTNMISCLAPIIFVLHIHSNKSITTTHSGNKSMLEMTESSEMAMISLQKSWLFFKGNSWPLIWVIVLVQGLASNECCIECSVASIQAHERPFLQYKYNLLWFSSWDYLLHNSAHTLKERKLESCVLRQCTKQTVQLASTG